MNKQKRYQITHPINRIFFLCVGLATMAFGVAFSVKADLGTSPISSVPYVMSVITGLSVGTTTIIINFAFIFIQIAILRKRFDPLQLLQFPATILFGTMIDLAGKIINPIGYTNYFEQWILCIIGIFLVAFGVSMEITANLVTTAGEGIVLAICKVAPIKFSNMKVVFDVTLVTSSILLSFIFIGGLDGVREGTIAAAFCVGLITKKSNVLLQRIEKVLLKS